MKRRALIIGFVVIAGLLWGKPLTLSVSDFLVESANPEYQFIGKGISRLVAGELMKSKTIQLIEREQLNKILEEQEFSLSDLADEKNQIEIGKLLAADYIVLGEIIDMVKTLLISVRLVDVSSGQVIWTEEITEKLETYDYIGAHFAKSILGKFKAEVKKSTVAKAEKKEEKKGEAIIKLSKGIDAYDRNDVQTAKKVLEEAKQLDPTSDVVKFYLAKLITNTTKFKVVTEPFYSYENPAYLGILKTDRFHFAVGGNYFSNFLYGGSLEGGFAPIPGYPDLTVRESDLRHFNFGYYFPVGSSLGMGVETMWSLVTDELVSEATYDEAISRRSPLGGILNLGYKIGDSAALGFGLSVYSQRDLGGWGGPREDIDAVAEGVNAGFLVKSTNERFIYDTRFAYSTGSLDIVDPDTVAIERVIHSPLFWENTFTFSNELKSTFFVIKQLNDLSPDRIYYYGRLSPAIEHYFVNWFSLRAGAEGAYILLNESHTFGYGVLGGITFRIIRWGLDIDINAAYRRKPSRVIEGMMRDDIFVTFNFNLNDVFLSR